MYQRTIQAFIKVREKLNYLFFIEKIKRKIFNLEDMLFEFQHGFDFSGIVTNENLITDQKASLAHATAYHAVWCRNLRELFEVAEMTGYLFSNFIDMGSGKGKACFYANSKKNFEKILGIEFSKPLVDIAEKNKARVNSNKIMFIHTDASTYILPNGNNFVFLFNPFDDVVLNQFITNNKIHFENNNSIIAYANDIFRISLINRGFKTIYRNEMRKISLYQFSCHKD